jgi:hypothetical protein
MSVKKKYHLFTILSVLVVSVGGILTWRGFAQGTVIPHGPDNFNTPADNTSFETWNLPAGFFVNSSAALSSAVHNWQEHFSGNNSDPCLTSDTIVDRPQDLVVPGETPIVLLQLKLVGVEQLRVSFPGFPDLLYNVIVEKSETPSDGRMSFNVDGTFGIVDFPINRMYKFVPTDTSQPIKCADSTTASNPDNTLVFSDFNLKGGHGHWFLSGNHCICFPDTHIDNRLDESGRPTHEHNAVNPSPTPTPTISPSPSLSPSPVPTATIGFKVGV